MFDLQDPRSNGMMLTKTGGECVEWGWEEEKEVEEEEEFDDQEGERRRKEEEESESEGGEDIEKVLFDSVTTRTRGSVMENEVGKIEEPRRGVPRQASSPSDDALPSSSAALSALPNLVISLLLLCTCICKHL